MGRFEKLRWVPMLIQAFNDARLKVATHQPGELEKQIDMVLQADNKKPLSTKPQPDLHLESKHRYGKHHNRKAPNSVKIHVKEQDGMTSQLLREIRATKRKLQGLDEIRQQLNGLRSSLNDFNGRINELQAKTDSTSIEGTNKNTGNVNSSQQVTPSSHHLQM